MLLKRQYYARSCICLQQLLQFYLAASGGLRIRPPPYPLKSVTPSPPHPCTTAAFASALSFCALLFASVADRLLLRGLCCTCGTCGTCGHLHTSMTTHIYNSMSAQYINSVSSMCPQGT
jgi:hypothetical protein